MIFARDEMIAKNPDLVRRFLRGWFKTIAYMKAHKKETVASAMATLSTRSLKERMLIGKLLLLMSKATAEIHYSLERDVIGIAWRTRTRVIAEASTLYWPALVRVVDGEGRTLVVWAACLHRSHGRIARGLCGLGRHVVCGPFPDEAERFEERVARFLGRELNQEDDWCPEWEE